MDTKEQMMEQPVDSAAKPIGPEQVKKFLQVLQRYKAGKASTERRIIASENWWKLRNTTEEKKETEVGADGGFSSKSGWLHNVIVSKHADAMESFPEPNILPREEGDKGEAQLLSAIVPCILEHNNFEETYCDAMWQKMKTGTGVYKVVWDRNMLNGLGDVRVENANLLNLYWEPGVTDIQKSRYFFQTRLVDKDILGQMHPEVKDSIKGNNIISSKFLYDDAVSDSDKVTVVECYYHKYQGGKRVLHYCKFVGDQVLFATENETGGMGDMGAPMAVTGLYDHGMYPYVFDPLFPIEGSPCGYGYVDLCKNPQTEIDIMKTSFVKNAMVGSVPRYFSQQEGNVNVEDFLDLSKPIVKVNGMVDETSLRRIDHTSLDGNYLNLLDMDIKELRETSGNTETSTGTAGSGVTAASAIAALQEASGKGSRDSTRSAYRAYAQIVNICIELIRQFYDLPRQFRILGQYGAERYISYTNAGIQPKHQGSSFGQDMGYRKPVFDIKVSAQKRNVYQKVTQNELALQFFQLGFFNPQMADQAIMCLDMMEFDGKDGIMQKISQNGMLMQKLMQYMQMALQMAQVANPAMVNMIAQDITATMGGSAVIPTSGSSVSIYQGDGMVGLEKQEHGQARAARERSNQASQPQ